MNKRSLFSGLMAGLSPFTPPAPPTPVSESFSLPGVTVINPRDRFLTGRTVTVSGGTIQSITKEDHRLDLPAARKEHRGDYVLPGLVDLHVHLPADNLLRLTGFAMLLFLRHGVTSVRDAGDTDGTAVSAARRGMSQGAFPGPQLFACGPFVSGHPKIAENSLVVRAEGDGARAVKQIKARNYCAVKCYEGLSLPQIREIVREARTVGLPVIGHVPAGLSYEDALIPDVQHFQGIPKPTDVSGISILQRTKDWQAVDGRRLEQIVETTLNHDIINTPTMVSIKALQNFADYTSAIQRSEFQRLPRLFREVVWHPKIGLPFFRGAESFLEDLKESFDKRCELLQRLYRAGARLQLGTDSGQPFTTWGRSLIDEMNIFHRSGIPTEEVWFLATSNAGRALNQPGLGKVEAGAPADLLVFERNPVGRMSNLDSLVAVISQGRLFRVTDLDKALLRWTDHFEKLVFERVSIAAAKKVMRAPSFKSTR